MTGNHISDEFPLVEQNSDNPQPAALEPEPGSDSGIETEKRETRSPVQTVGTHLLSVALVVVVLWAMRTFYLNAQSSPALLEDGPVAEAAEPEPVAVAAALQLPELESPGEFDLSTGLTRFAVLHTTIPTRPRVDVITYTVQRGDSLFAIADRFGLKPETVLWGNFDVLQDNPHLLQPGQVLNILPVNGTYHQWREGESLSKVAEFYQVAMETIIEYPGNRLDPITFSTDNPQLEPGTWLIVPGGQRQLRDWGPPAISRTNPASARYYGPGHCGSIYEGAVGTGAFVWPTTGRTISGYSYNPSIHPGIDIGGSPGNAIYATDSGVVVYAGWSNFGYGFLIVVDHGNGWQSAYAHLNSINVTCGQSVFQGTMIGGMGSTGNSSGPHLHFELVFNGAKVNPLDFAR